MLHLFYIYIRFVFQLISAFRKHVKRLRRCTCCSAGKSEDVKRAKTSKKRRGKKTYPVTAEVEMSAVRTASHEDDDADDNGIAGADVDADADAEHTLLVESAHSTEVDIESDPDSASTSSSADHEAATREYLCAWKRWIPADSRRQYVSVLYWCDNNCFENLLIDLRCRCSSLAQIIETMPMDILPVCLSAPLGTVPLGASIVMVTVIK